MIGIAAPGVEDRERARQFGYNNAMLESTIEDLAAAFAAVRQEERAAFDEAITQAKVKVLAENQNVKGCWHKDQDTLDLILGRMKANAKYFLEEIQEESAAAIRSDHDL